jgi:hypothetical protein
MVALAAEKKHENRYYDIHFVQETSVLKRVRLFIPFILLWLPALVFPAGPDVSLQDFDGKVRNVNEFIGQGKWTIVSIWSADCPICRREIYHMTFFHDAHRNKDATVLGVSINGHAGREKAQSFIDEQLLNFPNLIGDADSPERISGRLFIGTPTYYFFSPKGKYMTQRIGPVTQLQAESIIQDLEKRRETANKF